MKLLRSLMEVNSVLGKLSILPATGMLIYIVVSLIDKFIININDSIYISIMIIAFVIIIVGFYRNKRTRNAEK